MHHCLNKKKKNVWERGAAIGYLDRGGGKNCPHLTSQYKINEKYFLAIFYITIEPVLYLSQSK